MTPLEAVARAMCLDGGFDPNEIMTNDGPRWHYYTTLARAAIEALAANVTDEMGERARAHGVPFVAWAMA